MSSSIRRSDNGLRSRLAVVACVGALLVSVHLVLEGAARFAERRLGAFLWKQQDYLRLFSAENYVGKGAGRLLIYGPSESREGLLPEEIERAVPGFKPYQHSQSIGTLEDGLLVLEYIERAYGRSAIPDALLLGITTRFIGDIRVQPSPLQQGINLYSPHFRVEGDGHPPALVDRSRFELVGARFALLGLQPDRYRRGILAIAGRAATQVVPTLSAQRWTWEPAVPAKYLMGKWNTEAATKKWLTTPGNFWDKVHAWDPERDRERVTHELRLLLDYTARHHVQLYVVNMPELSWNRDLYLPGRYESYLSLVKEALGTTPFLDLRTFLANADFWDDAHPVWPAGIRVSRRVGEFIAEHRPDRTTPTPGRNP